MIDVAHTALQRDLAIAVAGADIAQKQLDAIQARHRECKVRVHALGEQVAAARDALRDVAGEGDAGEIVKARDALRAAESDLELATLEGEGIQRKIAQASRELASKRRIMCLLGVDVCRIAAAELETDARAWFGQFARTMRRRHQLAMLAANLGTEAAGRFSEPIHYSSETAGLLRDRDDHGLIELLAEHRLTETFSPGGGLEPAQLSELLELGLPAEARAAE